MEKLMAKEQGDVFGWVREAGGRSQCQIKMTLGSRALCCHRNALSHAQLFHLCICVRIAAAAAAGTLECNLSYLIFLSLAQAMKIHFGFIEMLK